MKKLLFLRIWHITTILAVLLFVCGVIGFRETFDALTANTAINPLKILVLFISMTVLSVFLDETGFLKYLANAILKRCGHNQIKLFTIFYIVVSVITVFTSNDIVILTLTPFMCYFAKNAHINPVPYLVAEFVAANTASMLLIIGNPTNIYLATFGGINFFEYLCVMFLPTILAVLTAYFVMLGLFFKHLRAPSTGTPDDIKLERKPIVFFALFTLLFCTILLAFSSYLGLEMWVLSLVFALFICVFACFFARKELFKTAKRTPWTLIPFVLSMFIVVLALTHHGVTARLSEFFNHGNLIFTFGFASVLFCNLINNIPMSVLFAGIPAVTQSKGALYAVIIGSNIGAFLTPIGALAGIMWLGILKHNGVKFSFWRFVFYGFIIAVPTLLAALVGLLILI
jgi:arsenical pump membrane protein